jgi:hypothetical protein
MKPKPGYIPITIGWIAGLMGGGLFGYFSTRNIEGDPSASFANLGLVLAIIASIMLFAVVFGLVSCLAVLLLGKYQRILLTMGYMLLLVCILMLLSSLLFFPVIFVPFVPVLARYFALKQWKPTQKVKQIN